MKGQGMRQSMSWLHGWSGLLLGWLLFAIFLTGTIAYFRQEVTAWMQPETAASRPSPHAAEIGLAKFAEVAPTAERWTISLPTDRSNVVRISWPRGEDGGGREGGRNREGASGGRTVEQAAGASRRNDAAAMRSRETRAGQARPERRASVPREGARGAGGGRRGGESLTLDASTGEVLHPRKTAGGDFLYRFHFELYALPREWARWIVGIATMAMFVAIVSGIITHKKIFKDFFTFRPAKGQRSWLDAHNATAVLSLPFHIMITFSGLVLFASTLLPWAGDAMFGDQRGSRQEARAAEAREADARRAAVARQGGDGTLAPIAPMLARAERHWGQPVSRIVVDNPGKPGSIVELLPMHNDRLSQQSGSGGLGDVKLRFNASTGAMLGEERNQPASAIAAVDAAIGSLHRARFASTGLRWLFFLAGVGGTIMVGTGLVLWSVKRAEKVKSAGLSFGHRLVDHLNVGGVVGLGVATGAYFWANRLLPVEMAGRAEKEISVFFAIWLLTFLHPLLRPLKRAWIEQLVLAGLLFTTLPMLNALTSEAHLGVTIPAGNWMVAGLDLVVFASGLALLYTARRVTTHRGRARPERKRTVSAAIPMGEVA
ncbi:MAG: PepSY-associated TM helix domain-containing protein [Novosphingobium sp.]